jgi:phospholipid/cholesterol/gamma-HCH transport system ATP-binding protein
MPVARSHAQPALLEAVAMGVRSRGPVATLEVELALRPGQFALVFSRNPELSHDVVDCLLGLVAPARGESRWMRHRWSDLDAHEALALRREIGRVQAGGNWMQTRSVMDNVLLPARHNTLVSESRLRETACNLARRFGLAGLPLQMPEGCVAADLEAAACVRAFLGRPRLVVLEHPLQYADSPLGAPIMQAIQQLRRRGGAALWFTEHLGLFLDASIPADVRLRVVGNHLVRVRNPAGGHAEAEGS